MSAFRVEPFGPDREGDFAALHADDAGAGWCRCVAWWVPTWEGWGDRTAADNAALRRDLCLRGEHDGLIAYDRGTPVGWCQLGPRDRLRKLVEELDLDPDPSVWAVTCFLVAQSHRRRGVARALLAAAIDHARRAGASRLEGYPRAQADEPDEMWTGARDLFLRAGFRVVGDRTPRSILSRDLHG